MEWRVRCRYCSLKKVGLCTTRWKISHRATTTTRFISSFAIDRQHFKKGKKQSKNKYESMVWKAHVVADIATAMKELAKLIN